jgi:hypothetical protein
MGEDCNSTLAPVPLLHALPSGSALDASQQVNVVRYLIWQVGPFQIDIRVESTNHSDRYKVAGLVVHTRSESDPQADITISLFNEDQELARTRTDLRGEFSIENSHSGNLQVRLAFSDEIYASVNVGIGVYRDNRK